MKAVIAIILLLMAVAGNCQTAFEEWIQSGKKDKYLIPQLDNKEWTNTETEFILSALNQFGSKSAAVEHYLKEGSMSIVLGKGMESMIKNFNRAWLIDSLNSDVYFNFGNFYLNFFDEDENAKIAGFSFYEKGLKINPNNGSLLMGIGLYFLEEYDFDNTLTVKLDDAIFYLLKADSIAPNHFIAYGLTRCYYLKVDCINARKYLDFTFERGGIGYVEGLSNKIEKRCSGEEIKLPSLNKVWGPTEYEILVHYLKTNPSYEYPTIRSKYLSNVFEKIVSYENLNVFTDQSLSADDRGRIVWPYFKLFPEIFDIYLEAELFNESVVITQFLMEMIKASSQLAMEKLKTSKEVETNEFKTEFGYGIFTTSMGVLDLMSQKEELNVEDIYVLNLANWFNMNFKELFNWFDVSGKSECKAKIKLLSETGFPEAIRPVMTDLYKKLD